MANVYATMAGSVWKLVVNVGDVIEEGQDVAILESMKMEIPISTEQAGTIVKLNVSEGEFVNEGDVIAELE
ncbi:acetyl-CoA carboxylase biotin carboxyl carrier protein subunit [Ectobacillus sp. sgz5001026]|uniref:acetyl-CoA carboxylase biotin carboxyl carrier protein subunit n=1 Tax=Ectobacillus sp. sgz5001026 TaxID=3242473 RepID=UPI0036D3E3D3